MIEPTIIAETDEYFVVSKPAGYAVERQNDLPSLYQWLLQKYGFLEKLERGGVVHRLDVETSGLVVWAKTATAQSELKLLWQGRQVEKTYLALVIGETEPAGTIDLNIERDNKNDRQKVAMLMTEKSRPALTTYKQLAVGEWGEKKLSLLEVHPITGRTHQIRVHLKAVGHPIIGDKLYGEKSTNELASALDLHRQYLHAWKIRLRDQSYSAPLPSELENALRKVNIDRLNS